MQRMDQPHRLLLQPPKRPAVLGQDFLRRTEPYHVVRLLCPTSNAAFEAAGVYAKQSATEHGKTRRL